MEIAQTLNSLIGSNLVIFTIGNTSFEGVLLDVKDDFLIIQKEKEIEHYFALDQIRSVRKNTKDSNVHLVGQNHTQKHQLIELLKELKYNWVTVNSHTKHMIEGTLNQVSTDYIMLIHGEEISYISTSSISNIYSPNKSVYKPYSSSDNSDRCETNNAIAVHIEKSIEAGLEVDKEVAYAKEKKDSAHVKNKKETVEATVTEEVIHAKEKKDSAHVKNKKETVEATVSGEVIHAEEKKDSAHVKNKKETVKTTVLEAVVSSEDEVFEKNKTANHSRSEIFFSSSESVGNNVYKSSEHINIQEMLTAQYYSLMKQAEKMYPKEHGEAYARQYQALAKNAEKMYKKLREKKQRTS